MQINFDSTDLKGMCKLMDELGDVNDMFFGKNKLGEDFSISIAHDSIVVSTSQNNGWIRKNYYYRDGRCEEIFEGRWR